MSRTGSRVHHEGHPQPRTAQVGALALLVVPIVAACASSGGGGPDTAAPTRSTVAISTPTSRGSVDIRTEASLMKSTVAVPPTQAWSVLPAVFEALGVPVGMSDPRSRLMGNEAYLARRLEGRPLSRYIDCGSGFSGPLADTYDVTLTVLTQLRDLDGQGTEVTTLVDAFAKARATSSNSIHCTSKQVLERRVGELIRENIVGR